MPEPSPLVHSLFDQLRLSPAVSAQMDWASGVLRVNRGVQQWKQYFLNPEGDHPLTVTLEHEAHHIIQISTLTYLYRFAVQIHAIMASVLDQHYGNLAGLPETLGEDGEMAKNLVWDLNWLDESGLSVIDIVESLTYFSQMNRERELPLSSDVYLSHLQSAPVSEKYKRGFQIFAAHTHTVPNASASFPILSHLSLCSWYPRKCFIFLAKAVAAGRITENTSLSDLLSLCKEAEPKFPGFAWEFSPKIPEMPFRLTFIEVQKMLVKDQEAVSKLWPYFFKPQTHWMDFGPQVLNQTPLLFNPISDVDYSDFRKWQIDMRGIRSFGAFTMKQRPLWPLYLAAVSRKYIEPIGVPPPGVVRVEK